MVLPGCLTRQGEPHSVILQPGLDTIDTVQLAQESVTEPVTLEQATQQVTQQVVEPNETPRTLELTLEEVRATALTNNLVLKVELVDSGISEKTLDAERAKFEAVFFGSAGHSYTEAVGTGTVSRPWWSEVGVSKPVAVGGTLEVGLPLSDSDPGGLAAAAASVSYIQSLLRGAGTRINTQSIRLAEHQWNIISARTKLAALNLLAFADITYWRLYAAQKDLDVRREQYKLAQDQLSHAQKKVAAGSAARIEIVRAEAGLAGRLEAVINAETTVGQYTRDLCRIMNRQDMSLERNVNIKTLTNPYPLGLALDEERLIEQALTQRMDMLQLEQALAMDELNIESARNAVLPDVTLSYSYTAHTQGRAARSALDNLSGNVYNDHAIGISAMIPLGNQAARAGLERACLVHLQDRIQLDRLRQIIQQDVIDAISQVNRNWRRILAAQQGVIAAERDYKVDQSQFKLGVRTSTDVLYSATRLADAQLGKIYAFTDYEIAQVNLARATGTLLGYGKVTLQPVPVNIP